jgi:hypothetical protein
MAKIHPKMDEFLLQPHLSLEERIERSEPYTTDTYVSLNTLPSNLVLFFSKNFTVPAI